MTDEKNKLPYRQAYEAEQIDLINVFMQIWRGKVIVALFVVLCLVIAGIYLAFAKEKWTSVAVISAPDAVIL